MFKKTLTPAQKKRNRKIIWYSFLLIILLIQSYLDRKNNA